MMKNKIKYILLIGLMLNLSSCFKENDFVIPDEFSWVGFDQNELSVAEEAGGAAVVNLIVSTKPLTEPLTLNLSISSDDAIEGVDYSLPVNNGTITVPAGASSVEVTLIESVLNNDNVTGDRTVEFELADGGGFRMGGPDGLYGAKVSVKILEDDLSIFGYCSFEESPAGPALYSAPDGLIMPNIDGAWVNYISTGGEMGYNLMYTEGNAGGEDDEVIVGVTNLTIHDEEDIGSFAEGSQGYVFSDADGEWELVFDKINIPAQQVLNLEMSWYFVDASWETDDYFKVLWRTEDGDEELIHLTGDDDNDWVLDPSGNSMISKWTKLNTDIANMKDGQLVIVVANNSGSEIFYIDDITIKGI